MLFKVTHIDALGHRHRARVTARNGADAQEQMDRLFGDAIGGGCIRMTTKPVLHVVATNNRVVNFKPGGVPCAS